MVRGLDYYNHTIFEIMVQSQAFAGREMTIVAGGRYNGLVAELGGPEVAGVGFALGVERLLLLLENEQVPLPQISGPDIYLVNADAASSVEVTRLLNELRQQGISAERDYLAKKVKGQFKQANRLQARYTLTIGTAELAAHQGRLKRMRDGKELTVDLTQLADLIAEVRKG